MENQEGNQPLQSTDEFVDEVETTFWCIFTLYVICSVLWILYCFCSYRKDIEKLDDKVKQNGIERNLEMQRLLEAYNRVAIGEIPQETQSEHQQV